MALTAYADADHAGFQDTRRSTFGSAQFLGDKLIPILILGNPVKEILLKLNLPNHRFKVTWRLEILVPVESIHKPCIIPLLPNQRTS
ncbi:hypothetical protein Tco_0650960 [Tanacetum coccineum]